jgi:predicted nuclease with RNAse H fold
VHHAVAAGIDVGGSKKGFHAVALQDAGLSAKLTTSSAEEVVAWCRRERVSAVGIDAPCQWSLTGGARPCERELAALGMSVFSTPNQVMGEVHPFYRWMVNGAELFRLLAPHYRLYDGRAPLADVLCFETFPHAIACTLAGQTLLARHKRVDRRRILEQAGVSSDALTTIDDIDAALCALAARYVLAGSFKAYGDAAEGFILVPTRGLVRSQISNLRFQISERR